MIRPFLNMLKFGAFKSAVNYDLTIRMLKTVAPGIEWQLFLTLLPSSVFPFEAVFQNI